MLRSGYDMPAAMLLVVVPHRFATQDDGTPVSVFEYDLTEAPKHFATNALRKLKTTRHPDVLKFMDAVETDTTIYIMTERVRPLQSVLKTWSSREPHQREDWLLWGLHRISVCFISPSPLHFKWRSLCFPGSFSVCERSMFLNPWKYLYQRYLCLPLW